ncbi:cell wall-binding repeat-containing protein [Clostridium senegalense]|uniref:cell wall-binding repeat-containing protein n=1 Tax=Clostridium senegalense TaxID=1465809 RepID=UPI000287A9F0|nr:cell wall-binding repeat-containing protein [Clostridium senegalense]
MKKSSRVVSTLLLGATVASASTGVFAVESKEIIKEKLAGETRFETAVEVSNKFGKADTVVLVNYTGIADALAATPLAKMKNAPILLTEAGSLTKATSDQITKLGAKKVIVIGGETAVSKNVVKQLEELKLDVERVAGEDRYATSEAVANEMGKDGKVEKVAVVNGIKGLADALSVAAPAAKEGMAIVLSDGTSVRAGQKVLDEAKTKYVIGGETVVSKELTEKLDAERLAGANRNATNAEVLNKFYDAKELDKVYVAKDGAAKENQLVDALAAGPLAGKEGNPLVLAGSELDKAQEAYLKDRIAKSLVEVGEGINQNTVSAIVKALTVKEETPSDKAEVTGVNVLNANQIEVKFNQAIDKDSAEDITNYEVKEDGKSDNILNKDKYQATSGKGDKAVNAKAEVQDDEKTVVITLPQAYTESNFYNQETIRVKAENIMTADKGNVFEKYENKNVKLFDNTLPELKEIKQVGPDVVDLVFSEPVTAKDSSAIVSAIRIDNGSYSVNAKTRVDSEKIDANVVRVTTSKDLEDGSHTLTIKENKIMDYAGLKLEAVEKKFEAKENKEDFTASVYKTSGKTVTLDFNKEVDEETATYEDNSNVEYYLDYENSDYIAKKAEMKDGKLELTFDKEIPSGDHKILVVYKSDSKNKDKVKDLWENDLKNTKIDFTVAKDTIAPKATVTYNKGDKKIEIKYSKKVDKDEAKQASNYQLKDEKGNYKTVEVKQKDDKNEIVYQIEAKNLSGKYTLTIKGNKIHDTSVERNAVEECSFELDTLDSKAPSVAGIRYGGDKDTNKIYVEYSEDMKTEGEGSILDKSLYHLDYNQDVKGDEKVDKTLDEIDDAKIELVDNKAVIITVPDNITNEPTVKVGRVCDANGNFAKIDGIEYILGATNKAVSDKKVDLLNGDQLDEDDILNKEKKVNANILDTNEIEVYLKGKVTSAVASKIKVDGKSAKKATLDEVTLKVNEGQYVKATKLKLEFNDDMDFVGKEIKFDDESLTTNLETKCEGNDAIALVVDKDKSDKSVADYVDDSANIYTNENNIATKIVFELTKEVKSISKYTFDVDGYNVDSAKVDGKIVTLTLDGKSTCVADKDGKVDIDVTQKEVIYDLQDNKAEGIEFTIESIVTKKGLEDKVAKAEEAVKEKASALTKAEETATEKASALTKAEETATEKASALTKAEETVTEKDDALKVAEKNLADNTEDAKKMN